MRGRFRRSRWSAGGLVAAGVFAWAGTARGDACSDCPPPSQAMLEQDEGMKLGDQDGPLGPIHDYYETDGGECRIRLGKPLKEQKRGEWIEAMMSGEAMNCPEGKVTSFVKLQLVHSDKYDWHLEGSASIEVGAKLLEALKAGVGVGGGKGGSDGVVAEIDQKIEPAYCHRIAWIAYFIVGDFGVTCPFSLERRFSWWTKNGATGATVHQSGQVWVPCESGNGAMARWAPLSSVLTLHDRACAGCALLAAGNMGWFPPLPERLKPFDPFRDEEGDEPQGAPATSPNPTNPPPVLPPDGKEPVKPGEPPEPPPAPPPAPNPGDPGSPNPPAEGGDDDGAATRVSWE